ncbi:S53 family peptidase [Flexivirga oryzae]|uniref:Subtilase family serine protease n=1 Tax=Flexivirga oryzae TaxID=1794944 RepID=A0A839NAX8_9MICO|nr:S53 family peptidase [Flexivirga oryzae]MBB2893989.1 subtilase family serine protease [Flexivirga oryzae]
MKRRHIATGAVALTTAVAMAGAGASMAHAAGQSTDNVRLTNSGRTALSNHTNLHTLGNASSSTNMSLSIAVPLRNQALLNSLLAKGTVISPAEYTRLFGASQASLHKVADWAKKQGLKVTSTDAASGFVEVSAPVRTVNKAFSLTMQRVTLGSHTGMAPNAAPLVPKSLGISSVVGLSTVSTRSTGPIRNNVVGAANAVSMTRSTLKSDSPVGKSSTSLGKSAVKAAAAQGGCAKYWGERLAVTAKKFDNMSNAQCGYTPQQAVKLYNAGKAASAKTNIGILLWCSDPDALSKANAISNNFSYPTLSGYHDESAAENPTYCSDTEVYGEQDMDVQISHYMSPKSSIYYYGASAPTDSALVSIFNKAVTQHKVSTISMSWGGDEAGQTTSFKQQFDRIAARASVTGISLFASSGDMGDGSIEVNHTKPSRGKNPSYPATSPFFTAVGGTAVGENSSGGRKFTLGWSNTLWDQPDGTTLKNVTRYPFWQNSVGAGGGVSKDYSQPAWQKGVVTGSTTKRTIPDVSADADTATGIYLTFDGQNATTSGGTSQSSPLVAALVASSKKLTGRNIGNAAPYFYKLKGTANIRDVKPTSTTYGAWLGQLNAAPHDNILEGLQEPADSLRVKSGWDNVTGLGEPTGSFLTAFGK